MSSQSQTNSRRVSPTDRVDEPAAAFTAWSGALSEFRNRLTELAVDGDLPDGLLAHAAQLASPKLGRDADVVVERAEAHAAGAALECLLAMLLLDLAEARAADAALPAPRVSLRAQSASGSLSIEIESEGLEPSDFSESSDSSTSPSWRLALAQELAGKLGARILPQLQPASYAVQFR
jgi:hypothetical protein